MAERGSHLGPSQFSASSGVVIVLVDLSLCAPPLRKVIRGHRTAAGYYGVTSPGREAFAAAGMSSDCWWSDPPIFFALWIFVIVLASNMAVFLAFTLIPNVLGSILAAAGTLSPFTVFVDQLALADHPPLRGAARRTTEPSGARRSTRIRPGSTAPTRGRSHIRRVCYPALVRRLRPLRCPAPDLYEQIREVSESLFNPESLSPVSAILFPLLIGAGLGEEALFRSAIQPALGITLTSVLFACMHVQYGPSFFLRYLLIISVGLGHLRRLINTTASFFARAGYNTLGVFLLYFFGV